MIMLISILQAYSTQIDFYSIFKHKDEGVKGKIIYYEY